MEAEMTDYRHMGSKKSTIINKVAEGQKQIYLSFIYIYCLAATIIGPVKHNYRI